MNLRNKTMASSWFLSAAAQGAALRLYCFAHAGGSAASYLSWRGALGPRVEVRPIQLPGRGGRFGEAAYTSISAMADAVCAAIADDARQPFAFFGHSMGALLAFETARRLQAAGGARPALLVVSGCSAPRHLAPPRGLHRMDDASLIAALRDYNGTPPELLAHREMMDLLLPLVRADFAAVETYAWQPAEPLHVPIVAFAARGDAHTRIEHVDRWADETTGSFETHWFDGDHFFIESAREAVWRRLADMLAAPTVRPWFCNAAC